MYYCNACGYELKIQVGICPVCGSPTGYTDAPELQAKYREKGRIPIFDEVVTGSLPEKIRGQ